jgi:hypothetical protein
MAGDARKAYLQGGIGAMRIAGVSSTAVLLALLLPAWAPAAEGRRLEAGVTLSALRIARHGSGPGDTVAGFGGWIGYRPTARVSLAASVSDFRADQLPVVGSGDRRRLQATLALAVGTPPRRLGFFARAGAGVVRTRANLITLPPLRVHANDLVVVLGGGAASHLGRLVLGAELCDSWVPHGEFYLRGHNPALSLVAGVRFGP